MIVEFILIIFLKFRIFLFVYLLFNLKFLGNLFYGYGGKNLWFMLFCLSLGDCCFGIYYFGIYLCGSFFLLC